MNKKDTSHSECSNEMIKKLGKPSRSRLRKLVTLSFILLATITAAALGPSAYIAVAAPVDPYGFGVALFKDVDTWGYPANEVILKRYGIPYDVYNSTDMGTVDLSKYAKVIIASAQNQVFYDTVNASRMWFEDYTENGGVLEIHAADFGLGSGWIDELPGGITYTYNGRNTVNIVTKHHPLVRTPNNITDTELDNWGWSAHGFFTAYPSGTLEILDEATGFNPVYIEVPFGSGVILASSQTLEYGYGVNPSSFFLENSILYLAPHENLDIQVNVGTVHFRGEIAEFYVKTSLYGNAINATVWEAILYTESGATQVDLLPNLAKITVGLYRISYTIPTDAVTGTYTLSVKASYRTGMTTATGHATASFIVSPTLTSQNSYITEVKDNVATVIVPDVGTIKADLNEIDAKVVEIDGNVATIQTDIGTMKTDVSNIDGILMGMEDTTANTYWFSIVATVLAAVGAGLAAIIVMLVRKKPKP